MIHCNLNEYLLEGGFKRKDKIALKSARWHMDARLLLLDIFGRSPFDSGLSHPLTFRPFFFELKKRKNLGLTQIIAFSASSLVEI